MVDLISHALWAYAIFHHQSDSGLYVLFSLFPDAIWAIPSLLALLAGDKILENVRNLRSSNRAKRFERIQGQPHFASIKFLYNAAHSWLLMGFAAGVIFEVFPKLALPFVGGVFLHLGLDLFLHKESPFGQYPLYPLSPFKVNGFIHWSDRRVLAVNFAALAVVYALIFAGYL